jgi:hypothetical protein
MTTIINGSSPSVTFSDSTTQASAYTSSTLINSAQLPTGSVLQVVQGTYATQTSTSSSSFVATGLTASITPKFATSKILVTGMMNFQGINNQDAYFSIFRNGATLSSSSSGFCIHEAGTSVMLCNDAINWLDSPATTSLTTYAIYAKCTGGNFYWCINGMPASLTLLEIAG